MCRRFFSLRVSSISLMCLAGSAFAAGPNIDPVPHSTGYPGYYVGAKVGDGFVDLNNVNVNGIQFSARDRSGLAGGLWLGYRFKPYVAMELGYDVFSSYHYQADLQHFVNASADITRNFYDFDLLARLIAPCSPFYATLAGGLAVILTSYTGIGSNGDASFARPKLEVGLGAYVTRRVSLGLAYSRIFAGGNIAPTITYVNNQQRLSVNKNTLPNINLATLNFSVDL